MAYNYLQAIKADVAAWIAENEDSIKEHVEDMKDTDALEEYLNDALWAEDSVTGNASGSYTFSSAKAKDYVTGNIELALEAYEEFDDKQRLARDLFDRAWELIDITIRCYLLGPAIEEALEEYQLQDSTPLPEHVIILEDGARIIEKQAPGCYEYYYNNKFIFGTEDQQTTLELQRLYNCGYFEEEEQ